MLKKETLQMLSLWNTDILEIWVEIYAIIMSKLIKLEEFQEQSTVLKEECRKAVITMAERNQAAKVRIKAANLLGLLAKYDSLGCKQTFKNYFIADSNNRARILSAICQDIHWEVRKQMSSHLITISKYLGEEIAKVYVLPEIKDLLEDEEGEVTSEAIFQFQKHLTYIFDEDFCKKQETIDMFINLMENSAEYDFTMVDIALVLNLLTKFMLIINQPENKLLLEKTKKMVDRAKSANFDEEIRAMLPSSFRGICQMYYPRITVLI